MKIFNAMFSKKKGGLEQAFLDYTMALNMQGNQVVSIIHPKAQIKEDMRVPYTAVHNFNRFDLFAVHRLTRLIRSEDPQCIITHGGRASHLFRNARTNVPIIGVSHNNSKFEYLLGLDAIIAITEQMRQDIIKAGQPADTVYTVPNMIHIPQGLGYREPINNEIPVIGVLSRFVPVKGIDIFIRSLAELRDREVKFKAKIAGEGPERKHYVELIQKCKLENEIELIGWITDKQAFYESLDIFCLPSKDEAFGLVVLEGLMYSLPMVLTMTSGPLEIAGNIGCAKFVPPSDYKAMANALVDIINNKTQASELSYKAFERAQYYSSLNIARMIQRVVEEVYYKRLNLKY